jgi:hypothetical protein
MFPSVEDRRVAEGVVWLHSHYLKSTTFRDGGHDARKIRLMRVTVKSPDSDRWVGVPLAPRRYTDRSGIVEEMGTVVFLVLGRGMAMVSQPECIVGNMPIPGFVEDSRTRVDGLGSYCIAVALGAAGDDVVEQDTD